MSLLLVGELCMIQDARCTRLPQLITRRPTLDGYVPTVPYTLCTPYPPAFSYLQRITSPPPSVHLSFSRLDKCQRCVVRQQPRLPLSVGHRTTLAYSRQNRPQSFPS
jgi:hypothetical protein